MPTKKDSDGVSSPVRVKSPLRTSKAKKAEQKSPIKSKTVLSPKSTPGKNRSGSRPQTLDLTPTKASPKKLFGLADAIKVDAKVQKVYHIVRKETGSIGGNADSGAIYGELTAGSMQKVINVLTDQCNLNHKSRFIDVGAGLGKPNLHAAQDPGCRISIGVELMELRWKLSMIVLDKFLPHVDNDLKHQPRMESVKVAELDTLPLHGGVNFVCGDIDDAETLDPFTHVYMYDLGFPPPLQQSIARKFNNSIHCEYLISYRPKERVISEYGYKVEFITSLNTRMHGSGENHMAYIYKRINKTPKLYLDSTDKTKLPSGSVAIHVPKRKGFDEEAADIACAACYANAVKAVLGPVKALQKITAASVNDYHNSARPVRERKPTVRSEAVLGGGLVNAEPESAQ